MNEEMYNTYEEPENTEEIEVYEEPETQSHSILGKVVAGALVVAVGAGALIYKNRAKLEQRRIEKLRKKGYVVYKTEVMDDPEEFVSEDEDDTK